MKFGQCHWISTSAWNREHPVNSLPLIDFLLIIGLQELWESFADRSFIRTLLELGSTYLCFVLIMGWKLSSASLMNAALSRRAYRALLRWVLSSTYLGTWTWNVPRNPTNQIQCQFLALTMSPKPRLWFLSMVQVGCEAGNLRIGSHTS